MSVVKKIIGLVAISALLYFTGGAAGIASFLGVSGFLGTLIGAAVLAVGTALIGAVFLTDGGQRAPDMEAGKVNVRLPEPQRWINAGTARQGGGVMFAEFDGDGNFWYLVVHSDSIMTGDPSYILDEIPVTLDASNYVRQADFRLKDNDEKDPATSLDDGIGYVQIWTTTYDENDPVPGRITALDGAFPSKWTIDHKLAGTTFSVVKLRALSIEHRYKIYRWRGAIGLGEPALSIVSQWDNVYDPRDETQTLGDRTTYKPSDNAALIWAWFRTHPYGRNKPESSINWDRIAEQADICDQTVTGIDGDTKRYSAGVSIIDSKTRAVAEREIMLAMDGQIVFDEDGKSWCRAGYYYAPTLAFSRNRDIMAMSTVEAQDGESETQGVIVRYTDPDANYTVQPSSAWINPLYYDPNSSPKFLIVDILACQNHNQAMRLAKGIGQRSQPRHKIGPTVNLRGLQARQERIVSVNYDNTFAGDYEIATPVELDGPGMFTGFGAVPVDENRWTLLSGEESPKPVVDGVGGAVTYPAITGESISVSGSSILLNFGTRPRADAIYLADYIPTSEITGGSSDPWVAMTVTGDVAATGPLENSVEYTIRYRYITGSGNGPSWEYITATTEAGNLSALSQAIFNSYILEVTNGTAVVSINADGTLTISNHTRVYPDAHPNVSVDGDVIATGLATGEQRSIAYDDETRTGGAVTYVVVTDDADARVSAANPYRHYVGFFTVPETGDAGGGGGGAPGGPSLTPT
jgi:hypothetical protein|tara:strand:+ start:37002 stop:39248 length:2247 start_codon:yes stop_codon:yes gene_type:complete